MAKTYMLITESGSDGFEYAFSINHDWAFIRSKIRSRIGKWVFAPRGKPLNLLVLARGKKVSKRKFVEHVGEENMFSALLG